MKGFQYILNSILLALFLYLSYKSLFSEWSRIDYLLMVFGMFSSVILNRKYIINSKNKSN